MIIAIIVAVVLVCVIIGISGAVNQEEKEKATAEAVAQNEASLSDFTSSKVFEGPMRNYKVCIDESNEKIAYISPDGTQVFSFEDIISVELLESGQTVSKKFTSRTIGGALIGGALAGGAGMVLGGLSGGLENAGK